MENKGTGRVCLRALPFLMALSGSVCLTPLWASETVKPSEEVLVQAQKKKISGVVKDETGEPVIGASVLIKGSMYGVITNIDGMFELSCPIKSSDVLVVSFVGMKTVEQPVGNNTKFNVVMHAAATDLEEIVVVGYGTSSVRDLTGSVASIGAKQLDQLNTTNVSSMLQNLASGVQVAQGTGKPGETVRVRVRGATSLTGSNERCT